MEGRARKWKDIGVIFFLTLCLFLVFGSARVFTVSGGTRHHHHLELIDMSIHVQTYNPKTLR